ncbi:MAG: hypothetical protein Kow00103_07780 [Candidatus Caldatribacteriota bacterium]
MQNQIFTRPRELEKNDPILYAGNHYLSVPIINPQNGTIKNINVVSFSNKALIELQGAEYILQPRFFKHGKEIKIERTKFSQVQYYIPRLEFDLEQGIKIIAEIYADLYEKGLIYRLESSEQIEVDLILEVQDVSLLRFSSHSLETKKFIAVDKWLHCPLIKIIGSGISLALALGGEEGFTYSQQGEKLLGHLKVAKQNCFYLSINFDSDGASATLIHLRRKGYKQIYQELIDWLKEKTIYYPQDLELEFRLNQNLFFNYFYSIAKDIENDRYLALTSRSPRYYVSGAFWERDSFLWSLPAIKLVNPSLYHHLLREMILLHSRNPGDHAHYLDGTVLYPGFELDGAASYFIYLNNLHEDDYSDSTLIKVLEQVWERIEREYDPLTGLYRTFLLPSDDPALYPLVTIDNVILWKGFQNLRNLYVKRKETAKAQLLQERIAGITRGIGKFLTREIEGKAMFLWSADGKGNFRLYNDPPGNLGLLSFYGWVKPDEPIFKNTIDYYYSARYPYYQAKARIKELACDHHPHTPSGLGLCGSILNPLRRKEALRYLKIVSMDYGLLSESFDGNTGEAKTGVGFATGAGYLAYSLYQVLIKEGERK